MYGYKDKYLKGSLILFPFIKLIVVGTLFGPIGPATGP